MRNDALGFFWQDEPPARVRNRGKRKEKFYCVPPEPIWNRPDYLPGLAESLAFNVPLMTDNDLWLSYLNKERLVFDCECYSNYFLAAFKSIVTGKVTYIEAYPGKKLDTERLSWIVENFTTIGFNTNKYDIPLTSMAVKGRSLGALKEFTNAIIVAKQQPYMLLRMAKVKRLKCDNIDLIEVAPLQASLKVYAGRFHCRKMQDLPFHPDTSLSSEQIAIVRYYCINDLDNTEGLYNILKPQVELRERMSSEYKVDLRSKSDAQIAEAVISHELERIVGVKPKKPTVAEGSFYRYNVPKFLNYQSETMKWVLNQVAKSYFVLDAQGKLILPKTIAGMDIPLGTSTYRLGQGGLHSKEKKQAVVCAPDYELIDHDVTSYYPFIIWNLGLFPEQLGRVFLSVYKAIIDRRVAAKAAHNDEVADTLKIVINGSFGKFGNKHSILFAPQLLIQTTITGQLSLLMLIEMLELNGIKVVSANTDGIVTYAHKSQSKLVTAIIEWWQKETHFNMEHTPYSAIYSRDVNNYIAVKTDGKVKTKGAYYNPFKDKDAQNRLKKNPTANVCTDAVCEFLTKGTPIDVYIKNNRNMGDFLVVRKCKDGGYKKGDYLGKAMRWYYSSEDDGPIISALKGSKVALSDNGRPQMQMPDEFPDDINHEMYIAISEKMLKSIGYYG